MQRDRRLLMRFRLAEFDTFPSREPSPEELAVRRQYGRFLRQHLAPLPDRCREVVTLVLFDELPHAVAAERLGITVNAVEKQVARGRKHFRRLLRFENGDLERVSPF